jgi:hypothetical protein
MSAKGFWVTQDGHLANLLPPVSAGAAVKTTRFSLAQYNHASIILQFGAASGPCGVVTLLAYAAETGGTGVAIPFRLVKFENASGPYDVPTNDASTNNSIFYETTSGFTPGQISSEDIANAMYVLEVEAADLLAAGNGTYLELDIAVGSMGSYAQLMSALAVLTGGRVTGDETASAQI